LFVYGKTGYGKTHLIQAIGNHIKQAKENPKVYYMTTEKFAIDFINSVQKNKVNQFKSKYRKYDVLIMDDIQFLSGKEKTQEELFHLFNTLHDNNKQIVFSSDMHPNYLSNFEDRLKSRFNAGMIVDISNPDKESRVAILKSKAKERDINVSDDIIECLASSIDSNIRELEGALNTVVVQSDLKEDELTVSEVKNLIRDNIKSQKAVPIDDIIQIIADFYNVDEESIHKKTRKRKVVKPRQIIMYVLREDYGIPYPTIGEKIGGRDHTTVIHSYEKIKDELNVDSQLAQEINQIRSML
jgi:chromosomal replication initiator protein